jgi:hypothetical protein
MSSAIGRQSHQVNTATDAASNQNAQRTIRIFGKSKVEPTKINCFSNE